jgi:hypothetical protein
MNQYHEVDSDSSDNSSEDELLLDLRKKRRKRFILAISLTPLLSLEYEDRYSRCRVGNQHRDRHSIMNWANNLCDNMFQRQFRLVREDFYYVVEKIKHYIGKTERGVQQAINSSGSEISVELHLMITLRILAGAAYLDMIHYMVHVDSVAGIVWITCKAIVKGLDNIHFTTDEEECFQISKQWAVKQKKRWNELLNVSTLYAGDGLAIEIARPSVTELRGRDIRLFRNRKGFWALIAQAFCDSNTEFAVFDIRWPGGTNDIIAYQMTDIYMAVMEGEFPEWVTFALDEAYSSCGGLHLTPFSIHMLRRAKRTNLGLYYMMLAFNNVLSSQRITIERAFGILIRRWGILWKPISFELRKIPAIVRACVMLHNVCVKRWVRNRGPQRQEFPHVPAHIYVDEDAPNDNSVMERMHNSYIDAKRASATSSIRKDIMEHIHSVGIQTMSDTEYHII